MLSSGLYKYTHTNTHMKTPRPPPSRESRLSPQTSPHLAHGKEARMLTGTLLPFLLLSQAPLACSIVAHVCQHGPPHTPPPVNRNLAISAHCKRSVPSTVIPVCRSKVHELEKLKV